MAFTYDLATDIGKVRIRLADTDSAHYAFEDAEITYFLTEGGSVIDATILGLQALITDAARRMKAFSNPGQFYDDRGRVTALQQALANLGGDIPLVTVGLAPLQPFDSNYVETTG